MVAITTTAFQRPKWRTIVLCALAFWLSSSILLDFVIMPGLYVGGMMTEPGFTTAGYSIFGLFNRVELVCAATVLTGILVLSATQGAVKSALSFSNRWVFPLSLGLLAIALIYTYGLTPEMTALGAQLNLFDASPVVPALMNQMHEEYWFLEVFKLVAGGALLGFCYKRA